jgi:hypothetical protein
MSAANPETFLELCQCAASECSTSLTGPSDTTTQTGRLAQIVNWVNKSWVEIQTRHNDWFFMRSSFTVDTTSGDGSYAFGDCTDSIAGGVIAAFRDWCGKTCKSWDVPMKIYLASAGVGTQTTLDYLPWGDFETLYLRGSPTNSHPRHWSQDPQMNLRLGPKPDGIYTVTGDFMKAATVLTADADTPEMPAEYRMAIVYGAMMKYGRYNAAPEVFTDGQAGFRRIMQEMGRTQRPPHEVGGPLA